MLLFGFKPFKIKKPAYVQGKVCSREYHYEPGDEKNQYYISVRFFANNIEYYTKSKFRTSYIKNGAKILLKYNKDNPNDCIIIPNKTIPVSAILFLFGIYIILSTLEIIPNFLH